MNQINILEREMTSAEYERMQKGFDEHTLENDVAIQQADRFGFVASHSNRFIGCSSGLAYKNDQMYSGWFYLTDLFIEKAFRTQGLGSVLLNALEHKLVGLGITKIWTWTAGYEAVGFYHKLGYVTFAEMEDWYSDGSSRVGLRKNISS